MKQGRFPDSTIEVVVLMLADQPVGTTAVEWATSALESGFDTPALRTLAGRDLADSPVSAEVRPLVATALGELGFPTTTFDEAARLYLREIASAVLSGRLAPRQAADLAHERIINPLRHPKDLMPWCYVWEGNAADGSHPLEPHEEEVEIRKVAAQFLRADI